MKSRIFLSKSAILIFVLFSMAMATAAFAQTGIDVSGVTDTGGGGLVTCTGPDCNFCHLVLSANKIISFIMVIATILATIMLAVSGFKLTAARGNPAALKEARQRVINFFIGVLLVFSAWYIIDTLMKVLISPTLSTTDGVSFGVWNKIDPALCGGENAVGTASGSVTYQNTYTNSIVLDSLEDYANEIETVGYGGATLNTNGTPVTNYDTSRFVSLSAAGVQVANWEGITGPGRTDLAVPEAVNAAKKMQADAERLYGKRIFHIQKVWDIVRGVCTIKALLLILMRLMEVRSIKLLRWHVMRDLLMC